ncbi:MAG: hypothetical protein K5883_02845 [Pseudobutyrivibrio sp.]|nr:hypothetical protein [Pseudobutyrivibrio sp.]
MINDFLKKYQEELISEKIQLKEDMDLLETKIKEETKFLSLLEESNESFFKEFTPRDVNEKNNEKAEEIRNSLNTLSIQMNEKKNRMKFYDGRLVEINSLINNNLIINQPSLKSTANLESVDNESVITDSSSLKDKLSSIMNLIVLDPYRAKIEMEELISSL